MLLNETNFSETVSYLSQWSEICVDCETTGLQWWRDAVVGIAFQAGGRSFYAPFRHSEGGNIPVERMAMLHKLFAEPTRVFITHNGKFDFLFLVHEGFPLPHQMRDTMLASHLLDENAPSQALKELAARFIDPDAKAPQTRLLQALAEKKLKSKGQMYQVSPDIVGEYAEADVNLTRKLYDFFIPFLHKHNLYDLWLEVCDYSLILTKMERRGIHVSAERTQQLRDQAAIEITANRQKIIDLAGFEINPSSPKQLSVWLGIPSTAHDVLEVLQQQEPRPAIEALLMFRGWLKADSTYYKKFLELKDETDSLHPNFRLIGTVTGRLSCSTPNLQAIPRTKPIMRVKECLTARPGYVFVQADLSQAELRMGCYYAKEDRMGQLLMQGVDIHQATADQAHVDRQVAKSLNFGVLYGLGPRTLAKQLNIPESQAKGFLRRYHATYPGFKALYRKAQLTAEQRGEIRLWTGRRRRFNLSTPTHKAIANLVQGSVAEYVRVAIMQLDKAFEGKDWHQILQVHDSTLCEVPESELYLALPIIKRIMENPLPGTRYANYKFAYPFTVDMKFGPSLADGALIKWEPESNLKEAS